MANIKTNFECEQLWLSETFGGYDWICNYSGKECQAVEWNLKKECFEMKHPEKCCKKATLAALKND